MAVIMGKIPADLRVTIARNITDLRLKKYPGRGGAKRCAMEFGSLPQQWSRWERGHTTPNETRMAEIAAFFGTEVEDLRRKKRPESLEPRSPPETVSSVPPSPETVYGIPPLDKRGHFDTADILVQAGSHSSGSPASFYYLALYFVTTLLKQGVRMDKQCPDHVIDRIESHLAQK